MNTLSQFAIGTMGISLQCSLSIAGFMYISGLNVHISRFASSIAGISIWPMLLFAWIMGLTRILFRLLVTASRSRGCKPQVILQFAK